MTEGQKPKTYLVTGGTGSLGVALTQRLLAGGAKVRAYARNEHGHERLLEATPKKYHVNLATQVGDVRDYRRLKRAMEDVDLVIHAAAMKVVHRCEYDPKEAWRTNVEGTQNVADCVLDLGVQRALIVSTDKARAPVTLYGATKLAAERVWLASNRYRGGKGGCFAGVVYGNVFGSNGSILHAFREQATSGTIRITDPRCTRFHIRLEQAVDFVLRALACASPGELWVPKLPSYQVIDFAAVAVPQSVKIELIGLRASEKIHEVLVSGDEAIYAREEDHHYVVTPDKLQGPGGWEYHSGRNRPWMSREDLLEEIRIYSENHEGGKGGK